MGKEDKKDYLFHLKEAEKYKREGNFLAQMRELNLSRRDGLKEKGPLFELYKLFIDYGKWRNAKKLIKELYNLYPDDPKIKDEFNSLLKEKEYSEAEISNENELPTLKDSIILRFIELFQPREGVYARMWKNPDGEISYSPVNEPFTFNVAKNHLLGNYTVGVYPVRIDNTVLFSAFDIDVKKEVLKDALLSEEDYNLLKKKAYDVSLSIKEVLNVYGIYSIIEDSGFKGYHVWLFFDSPIPAHYIRVFMQNVLKGVEGVPHEISIEIFPKQSKVKEGRYGSLIKLPGGIHLKTGIKSFFIGDNGEEIPINKALFGIKKNRKSLIEGIVSQIRVVEDDIKKEEIDLRELSYLRSKCAVLDYLIEKAEKEEPLTRDERLVMVYTIGHLKEGPEIINHLLKKYIEKGDLQPLKKKLSGYPTSCAKIRKKLKHITAEVSCACVFEDIGEYPNPLLHLKELSQKELKSIEVKPLLSDFEKYVRRYIEIARKIGELEEEKKNIETYFNEKFDRAGVDTLELKVGKLKRVLHPSGEYKFYYEL